ncbi:uncharacterized protein LOC119386292 [Rhipicephalus sanguineus]|uniref:uncharacterized protein LOC119386292 n=1 Tax=Rhipicephalus sanguineus TaxID=34632 RepID=UPI0020C53EED|nr:uncharacterized protein LOC119386292 [Rhipicephalus sanguineus]
MTAFVDVECRRNRKGVGSSSSCLWRLHARVENPVTLGMVADVCWIREGEVRSAVASTKYRLVVFGHKRDIHERSTLRGLPKTLISIKRDGNTVTDSVSSPGSCIQRPHARIPRVHGTRCTELHPSQPGRSWQDASASCCSIATMPCTF